MDVMGEYPVVFGAWIEMIDIGDWYIYPGGGSTGALYA
jgi:hypothetical protein